MQIYTGNRQAKGKGRKQHSDAASKRVPMTPTILLHSQPSVGEYVALKLPQYPEQPQIGKVLGIKETTVKVDWMKGGYTTAWKPYLLKKGRVLVHWEEEVDKKFILPGTIEFTKSMRLTSSSVCHLRTAYKD